MDIYRAIKTRKSVRSFLDRDIEEDKLQRILEAVRLAPSAKNLQEWRFVVVRDRQKREQLAMAAHNQAFVGEAPVVIACCAETDKHVMRCGLECYPIDVAIAIDHLTLAAVSEGLGTCWIGSFESDRVKELLGIPEDIVVVELLPLGYPQDPAIKEKSRLKLAEIVHYERW
ncbi:MAG TPA: nitroreductase [Spirochaetales bacterium]|nr:nitroreductase [Spirochaetales bacterium]